MNEIISRENVIWQFACIYSTYTIMNVNVLSNTNSFMHDVYFGRYVAEKLATAVQPAAAARSRLHDLSIPILRVALEQIFDEVVPVDRDQCATQHFRLKQKQHVLTLYLCDVMRAHVPC